MTDTPSRPPITPRNWPRWLLIGSLALNLLVVGLVVGVAMRGPAGPMRGGLDLGMGPFARALDDDDRRAIRRDLLGSVGPQIPSRADRGRDRAALLAALAADPFDAQAVAAVLSRQAARNTLMADAARAALLTRLGQMPARDRRAFAERLVRELDHSGPP